MPNALMLPPNATPSPAESVNEEIIMRDLIVASDRQSYRVIDEFGKLGIKNSQRAYAEF